VLTVEWTLFSPMESKDISLARGFQPQSVALSAGSGGGIPWCGKGVSYDQAT